MESIKYISLDLRIFFLSAGREQLPTSIQEPVKIFQQKITVLNKSYDICMRQKKKDEFSASKMK